jgi:hypothetical protein
MTEGTPRRGRAYWQPLIEELEQSGLTHAEFAAQRGIGVGNLRAWLYRLRREQKASGDACGGTVRMVPVHVAAASSAVLEVLVGRCTVRVGPQADPAAVAALVTALEAGC